MDLVGALLSGVRAVSPLLSIDRIGDGAALSIPSIAGAPFHYVLSGAYQLVSSKESIPLNAGDLVLLPHGAPHRLQAGDGVSETDVIDYLRTHDLPIWTAAQGLDQPLFIDVGTMPPAAVLLSGVIVFEEPGANMLLPHLPELIVFRDAGNEIGGITQAVTELIGHEGRAHDPGYCAVALRILELLIIVALRRWLLATPHESGWLRGLQDPIVSKTLLAMHRNPGRQWQVGSLAEQAGCSRSLFAKRFHAVVGETPLGYLTRLRIGIASVQLRDPSRSLTEIAAGLGYSSASAFARAFKENVGRPPRSSAAIGPDALKTPRTRV